MHPILLRKRFPAPEKFEKKRNEQMKEKEEIGGIIIIKKCGNSKLEAFGLPCNSDRKRGFEWRRDCR